MKKLFDFQNAMQSVRGRRGIRSIESLIMVHTRSPGPVDGGPKNFFEAHKCSPAENGTFRHLILSYGYAEYSKHDHHPTPIISALITLITLTLPSKLFPEVKYKPFLFYFFETCAYPLHVRNLNY
jgi:hypothetical protein